MIGGEEHQQSATAINNYNSNNTTNDDNVIDNPLDSISKHKDLNMDTVKEVSGSTTNNGLSEETEGNDARKTKKPKSQRRYWNNRLSRKQYLITVTLLSLLGFFAFALTLCYAVILRFIIPKIFWGIIFEGNWNGIIVEDFILRDLVDDGFTSKFYLRSRKLQLPVSWAYAELQPINFTFSTMDNKRQLFRMTINDPLNLNGWERLKLYMDPWELHFPDTQNARQAITSFADYLVGANNTNNVLNPPFKIYIEGWSTVWVCGLPVYNINFYREQKLDFTSAYNWIGRNVFGGISTLLDQNSFNNYLGSLGNLALASNGSVAHGLPEIAQEVDEDEMGSTKVSDINFNIDHRGLFLNLKGKFINDQNTVFNFGTISLLVKLNKQVLAEVRIVGLKISREDPNFDVRFEVIPRIEGDIDMIKRALDAIGAGRLAGVTAGIKNISIKKYDETNIPWLDEILGGVDFDIDLESFQKQFFSLSNPGGVFSSVGGALGINNLAVRFETNNTIRIQPNITLPETFNSNIHVAPFTAKLAADNGAFLATLNVPEIRIGPKESKNQATAIIIKLEESDESAVAAGQVISPALMNSKSYLALGNFVFEGKEDMTGLNALFSVLRIRIPLQKLIWGSAFNPEPLLSVAGAKSAKATAATRLFTSSQEVFDSVEDIPPTIQLALNEAELVGRATGLSLLTKLNIVSRLPLDILVPFLQLRTSIDDLDLISVALNNVSLAKGSKSESPSLNLNFGNDARLPSIIADLISKFLDEEKRLTINNTLTIEGIRLGPNTLETYPLFNKLNLTIPGYTLALLPSLFGGSENSSATAAAPNTTNNPAPGALGEVPTLPEQPKPPFFKFSIGGKDSFEWSSLIPVISSLGVSTAPDTLVIEARANFKQDGPFKINIPFAGVIVQLDNNRFATVSVNHLTLPAAQGTPPIQLRALMADGESIEMKTATWLKDLLQGSTDIKTKIVGITFGESQEKSVQALSGLVIPLPFAQKSNKRNNDSGGKKSSWFALDSIFPAIKDFKLGDIKPELRNLDFETQVSASLFAKIDASFNNSLPISIDIPYLTVDLAVEGTRLVSLNLQGLNITQGAQVTSVSAIASFNNGEANQKKVEKLFGALFDQSGSVKAGLFGIRFGPSSSTTVNTFRSIDAAFSLGSGNKTMDRESSSSAFNIGALGSLLPSYGNSTLHTQLKGLDISTTTEGLSIALSVEANNPLPVTIKVGYTSIAISVNSGKRVMDASLQALSVGSGQQALSTTIYLAFNRDSSVADEIAELVKNIAEGKPVQIRLGGVRLGQSSTDYIDAFSRINLPLAVPSLGGLLASGLAGNKNNRPGSNTQIGNNGTLVSSNGFELKQLNSIDVSTVSYGLDLALSAVIVNTWPISVAIGYMSIEVKTKQKGVRILELSSDDLRLARGQGDLKIALQLALGKGTEVAENVKGIFDSVLQGEDIEIRLGAIQFGALYDDRFTFLSKLDIPLTIPVSSLGGKAKDGSGNTSSADASNGLFAGLPSLNSVEVSTTEKGLGVIAGLKYEGLPFPINVKLGYVATDALLDESRLASISTVNLNLQQSGYDDLKIPLAVNIAPEDPSISIKIAKILNPILSGDPMEGFTLTVGKFMLGEEPNNKFDTFSKIAFSFTVPVEQINRFFKPFGSTAMIGNNPTNIIPNANVGTRGFKFSDISVETIADGLALQLALELDGLSFPVQLKVDVGYIGLDLALLKTKFAKIAVSDLQLTSASSQKFDLKPTLTLLPEDENLASRMGKFVEDILNGEDGSGNLDVGISGIVFGSDAQHTFQILSLVNYEQTFSLSDNVRKLTDKKTGGLLALIGKSKVGSSGLGNLEKEGSSLPLKSLDVSLSTEGNLIGKLHLALDLVSVTGSVGYLGASVLSEGEPIVDISIRSTQLTTGNVMSEVELKLAKTDDAAGAFARLVDSILSGVGFIELTGLEFGLDAKRTFKGLSLIRVPLPIILGGGSGSVTGKSGKNNVTEQSLVSNVTGKFVVVPTGIQGETTFVLGNILADSLKVKLGKATGSLASDSGSVKYVTLDIFNLMLVQNQALTSPIKLDLKVPVNTDIQKELDKFLYTMDLPFTLTGFSVGRQGQNDYVNLFSQVKIPLKRLFQGGNFDWTTIIKFYKPIPRPLKFALDVPFDFYPDLDIQVGSVAADFNVKTSKVASVTVKELVAKQGKNTLVVKASIKWFAALWKLIQEIFSSGKPGNIVNDLTISQIVAATMDNRNIAWLTESLRGYVLKIGKLIQVMTEKKLIDPFPTDANNNDGTTSIQPETGSNSTEL